MIKNPFISVFDTHNFTVFDTFENTDNSFFFASCYTDLFMIEKYPHLSVLTFEYLITIPLLYRNSKFSSLTKNLFSNQIRIIRWFSNNYKKDCTSSSHSTKLICRKMRLVHARPHFARIRLARDLTLAAREPAPSLAKSSSRSSVRSSSSSSCSPFGIRRRFGRAGPPFVDPAGDSGLNERRTSTDDTSRDDHKSHPAH